MKFFLDDGHNTVCGEYFYDRGLDFEEVQKQ